MVNVVRFGSRVCADRPMRALDSFSTRLIVAPPMPIRYPTMSFDTLNSDDKL